MRKRLNFLNLTTLLLSSITISGAAIFNASHFRKNDKVQETMTQEVNSNIIPVSKQSKFAMINKILPYVNNKILADDFVVNNLSEFFENLKDISPDFEKYFTYFDSTILFINELENDWYQESDYGDTTVEAMNKFINSSQGDIAQAKNIAKQEQWYYVKNRAKKWNWNNFYEYIAGANMNYMIKVLTSDDNSNGYYIGELINKHLSLETFKWGFDQKGFLNDFSLALKKISKTKEALPYLIKTLVPLLKIKFLKVENPTIGFDKLTWESEGNNDLSLKNLLKELKHLLSPEGQNDLISIFTSLLTGSFGEDIIINCGSLGNYTFPELLAKINKSPISWLVGDMIKPEVLATKIVTNLTSSIETLNLNNIFTQFEQEIPQNFVINLKDFNSDLKVFFSDNFKTGLEQLIDIIKNPDGSSYSLSEIFKLWGVQDNNEVEFEVNSPLFIIRKWINEPDSFFNQILKLLDNFLEKTKEINKVEELK